MSRDTRNAEQRHEDRRRGIKGAGKALRKEAARAGNPISQEAAERRVRQAVDLNDQRNNRG